MSYNIVKWNCIVYYNNYKCIYVLKQKLSPKKKSCNKHIKQLWYKRISWKRLLHRVNSRKFDFFYILTKMNEQCASIRRSIIMMKKITLKKTIKTTNERSIPLNFFFKVEMTGLLIRYTWEFLSFFQNMHSVCNSWQYL